MDREEARKKFAVEKPPESSVPTFSSAGTESLKRYADTKGPVDIASTKNPLSPGDTNYQGWYAKSVIQKLIGNRKVGEKEEKIFKKKLKKNSEKAQKEKKSYKSPKKPKKSSKQSEDKYLKNKWISLLCLPNRFQGPHRKRKPLVIWNYIKLSFAIIFCWTAGTPHPLLQVGGISLWSELGVPQLTTSRFLHVWRTGLNFDWTDPIELNFPPPIDIFRVLGPKRP